MIDVLKKIQLAAPVASPLIVLSPFGARNGRLHPGVDLSILAGSRALAAADGFVAAAYGSASLGGVVVVYHRGGWETHYGHLDKFEVWAGLEIKVGDTVGLVGSHLHFEVRRDGVPLDPMQFLNN